MGLGVIGFGARARDVLNEIRRLDPTCRITAITDVENNKIRDSIGVDGTDVNYFDDPDIMLNSSKLDGIIIGTRCSLHTKLALKVLPTGIPLFLEKPVATTYEDFKLLMEASKISKSEVVVSFPLRGSGLVKLAKEIIDSGRIGSVENVQAVNNVPYGSIYFQNWYRDESETHGLFLQKATHDFDYIGYLLGMNPVSICAISSKQIFKGTKPAKLKCVECIDQDCCLESETLKRRNNDFIGGEYCCFAVDTGNEDSSSALIRYESGMHVSYSQNFFARRGAQARGARFFGYKGTLEFDFYTGILKVYMHHTPRVETYELSQAGNHFGGDTALARNFIDIVHKKCCSDFSLKDGLLSALICLKARESAATDSFQEISADWISGNDRN